MKPWEMAAKNEQNTVQQNMAPWDLAKQDTQEVVEQEPTQEPVEAMNPWDIAAQEEQPAQASDWKSKLLQGTLDTLEVISRPERAITATVLSPFSEDISLTDVPKILSGEGRTSSEMWESLLNEKELPDSHLFDIFGFKVNTSDLLGFGSDVVAGGAFGGALIKGLRYGTKAVKGLSPTLDAVMGRVGKPLETTIDIVYGGKPKGNVSEELPEDVVSKLKLELANIDAATTEARRTYERAVRDGLNYEDLSTNILSTTQKTLKPYHAIWDTVETKTGIPTVTAYRNLLDGVQKTEGTITSVSKFLGDRYNNLTKMGVNEDNFTTFLKNIESSGKIVDESVFKNVANKDGIVKEMTQVRKSLDDMFDTMASTRMEELGITLSNALNESGISSAGVDKLVKNFNTVFKYLRDTSTGQNRNLLRKLTTDNENLRKHLLRGVNETEKKRLNNVLTILFDNSPAIEYHKGYVRAMRGEVLRSKNLSDIRRKGKNIGVKEILDTKTGYPSILLHRADNIPEELLEKDPKMILRTYVKGYTDYMFMRKPLQEAQEIRKQLGGVKILSDEESVNFARKLQLAARDVVNNKLTDKIDNDLFSVMSKDGALSFQEKHVLNDFIDANKDTIKELNRYRNAKDFDSYAVADAIDIAENLYNGFLDGDTSFMTLYRALNHLKKTVVKDLGDPNSITSLESLIFKLKTSAKENGIVDAYTKRRIFDSLDIVKKRFKKKEDAMMGKLAFTQGGFEAASSDFVKTVDNYIKEGMPTIHTDAAKLYDDFLMDTLGYRSTEEYTMSNRIKDTFNRFAPTGSKKRAAMDWISEKIGLSLNKDATWEDLTDFLRTEVYSNVMGFRFNNVIRNLTQPLLHTLPQLNVSAVDKLRLSKKALEKFGDIGAWKEFRDTFLKSNYITSDIDDPIRQILSNDAKLSRFINKGIDTKNTTAMFLYNASDLVNRFNAYNMAKEAAEITIKKDSFKSINKLLNTAYVRSGDRSRLLNILNDFGKDEFIKEYAKLMTNQTQFVYKNIARNPVLRKKWARMLFMFAKWPTEIATREAHFAKELFIKGNLTGGKALAQDFLYGATLFYLGKEMLGLDFTSYHPTASLTMPAQSPLIRAPFEATSTPRGEGLFTTEDYSPLAQAGRTLRQSLLPYDALAKTVKGLAGKRKGYNRLGIKEYKKGDVQNYFEYTPFGIFRKATE